MTITQGAINQGQPGPVTRSDLSMCMAAVGGQGAVLQTGETGGTGLALKADAGDGLPGGRSRLPDRRLQLTAVTASTQSSYRLSVVSGLTSPSQPSRFFTASGMSRQAPRLRAHGPNRPVAFFLSCPWSVGSASLLY